MSTNSFHFREVHDCISVTSSVGSCASTENEEDVDDDDSFIVNDNDTIGQTLEEDPDRSHPDGDYPLPPPPNSDDPSRYERSGFQEVKNYENAPPRHPAVRMDDLPQEVGTIHKHEHEHEGGGMSMPMGTLVDHTHETDQDHPLQYSQSSSSSSWEPHASLHSSSDDDDDDVDDEDGSHGDVGFPSDDGGNDNERLPLPSPPLPAFVWNHQTVTVRSRARTKAKPTVASAADQTTTPPTGTTRPSVTKTMPTPRTGTGLVPSTHKARLDETSFAWTPLPPRPPPPVFPFRGDRVTAKRNAKVTATTTPARISPAPDTGGSLKRSPTTTPTMLTPRKKNGPSPPSSAPKKAKPSGFPYDSGLPDDATCRWDLYNGSSDSYRLSEAQQRRRDSVRHDSITFLRDMAKKRQRRRSCQLHGYSPITTNKNTNTNTNKTTTTNTLRDITNQRREPLPHHNNYHEAGKTGNPTAAMKVTKGKTLPQLPLPRRTNNGGNAKRKDAETTPTTTKTKPNTPTVQMDGLEQGFAGLGLMGGNTASTTANILVGEDPKAKQADGRKSDIFNHKTMKRKSQDTIRSCDSDGSQTLTLTSRPRLSTQSNVDQKNPTDRTDTDTKDPIDRLWSEWFQRHQQQPHSGSLFPRAHAHHPHHNKKHKPGPSLMTASNVSFWSATSKPPAYRSSSRNDNDDQDDDDDDNEASRCDDKTDNKTAVHPYNHGGTMTIPKRDTNERRLDGTNTGGGGDAFLPVNPTTTTTTTTTPMVRSTVENIPQDSDPKYGQHKEQYNHKNEYESESFSMVFDNNNTHQAHHSDHKKPNDPYAFPLPVFRIPPMPYHGMGSRKQQGEGKKS